MAASPGPLTTHVLNTAMGIPASNLALHLYRRDPSTSAWSLIRAGYGPSRLHVHWWETTAMHSVYIRCHLTFAVNRTTDEDGRCPGLITPQAFTSDVYKIHFETGKYWESMGETSFYPYVEVRGNSAVSTLEPSNISNSPAAKIKVLLLIKKNRHVGFLCCRLSSL